MEKKKNSKGKKCSCWLIGQHRELPWLQMIFKEVLSSTWPFSLEVDWMGDKVFIQDIFKKSFIESRFYWSWSTRLSLRPTEKNPFRKWRAISSGRRAIEALLLKEGQSLKHWAQRRDLGRHLKRAALIEKVIEDKEEELSGKLDWGYSYFSFKKRQLLISLMYKKKSNPFNFIIA